MSGEALALETQLLLQEVTQAKQFEVAVVVGDEALPPVSEFEAAKLSLVEKLRKKKELNRQQQQQLNAKRYGIKPTVATATAAQSQPQSQADAIERLTPTKAKRMAAKLPVAATGHAGSRQKKDLLSKLKSQAIQQGAQEMAKLFGYKSYEDQIKHLNEIEQKKLLESAKKEKDDKLKEAKPATVELDKDDEDSSSDYADGDVDVQNVEQEEEAPTTEAQEVTESTPQTQVETVAVDEAMEQAEPYEETQDLEALEAQEAATRQASGSPSVLSTARKAAEGGTEVVRRHRNQIAVDDEDNDGNEADSEEDGKDEAEDEEEDEEEDKTPRDKAAAFRQLLQAEAAQNRKRKRLRKGGADFVDDEAEEDEEEDVLKIGGLGDFGFGVPQAASKESKEAEDERNALKLREDDLEGIVDDLSDDERAQEQDLEEIHRKELEDLDRQQIKEVMRNVKEGFGRNRRAFSNLEGGSAARGRFNLNDLVAADGDKTEAARLGLLESDEEMNDDDEDEEADESKKNEEEVEEDEEAEMERMLRERYQNQPKIYITSSESENEDENEVEEQDDEAVKEEIESDEERERQQMKLFSERARINRRMQRMKDMQRQIAEDTEEPASKAPLPNILLEEDEDSQSLLKVLNRTDVSKAPENSVVPSKDNKTQAARPKGPAATTGNRPKIGRFNSFGMGSSVSRSTSSFSRVVDNCKLFSAGSTSSSAKGFVFTSFSSDKTDRTDENAAPGAVDSGVADATPSSASLAKSKSWGGSSAASRTAKRPFAASNGASGAAGDATKKRKSDFFSVLTSYQCVSQSTDQ